MAAGAEDQIDLVVSSKEPLRLPGCLELPEYPLALSGRPVRDFDHVIEPLVRPMLSVRRKGSDRLDVTAKFVRDHNPWRGESGHQSAQETPRCLRIPTWLNQNVKHVAVRVGGPP